jgi:hypothetical protein
MFTAYYNFKHELHDERLKNANTYVKLLPCTLINSDY